MIKLPVGFWVELQFPYSCKLSSTQDIQASIKRAFDIEVNPERIKVNLPRESNPLSVTVSLSNFHLERVLNAVLAGYISQDRPVAATRVRKVMQESNHLSLI
jgi:hypothetical protein